jgi:hypothetical protein
MAPKTLAECMPNIDRLAQANALAAEIGNGGWRRAMLEPPGRPPDEAAAQAEPPTDVLALLTPEEREMFDRVPAADQARLLREFRGGATPTGLSYLRKKIALLAMPLPAAADQGVELEPAAKPV